ncbi:hypothetical protein CEW46_27680 [Bacillus cereus]|nr:hypothetical protein CEW46_27680 [Bacillus cereus]
MTNATEVKKSLRNIGFQKTLVSPFDNGKGIIEREVWELKNEDVQCKLVIVYYTLKDIQVYVQVHYPNKFDSEGSTTECTLSNLIDILATYSIKEELISADDY